MVDGFARFPDLREKEPTLMGTYALEIPYNILKTTYNGCRSLLKK